MAKFLYFSDIGGEAVELKSVYGMDNNEFTRRWPGIRGRRCDSFSRLVGLPNGQRGDDNALPVTRSIEYKSNPSLHKCDVRCQHAKGHLCECSCGGKNHGINRTERTTNDRLH